jgi:trehalose/maltose transport system substrate-binding protein
VWLPLIADKLADLTAEFADEMATTFPALVNACQIDGRLMALPYHVNLGMLFYRSDLLDKYGYDAPPATWTELEEMAATIQAGERARGIADFWGYIWPGQLSEALTCISLEWLHSEGGGSIIEPDGRVSIANPHAAAALNRAAGWVGTISPPDFTDQTLATLSAVWETGKAAFMRFWSGFGNRYFGSQMGEVTKITLLPSGSVRRAATLGGAPLGVHRATEHYEKAIELIRERASIRAQRMTTRHSITDLPARFALYDDPQLLAVNPELPAIRDLIASGGMAVRPNKIAGSLYPEVVAAYAQTVAAVLSGQADAAPALAELALTLTALGGWPSD